MQGNVGKYSFIVGVIIAIILGLVSSESLGSAGGWLWSILIVLGFIVGLLNISGKETKEFLWIAVALVLVTFAASSHISSWNNVELIGTYVNGVFNSLMAFIVPATIIVALKSVWNLAKGG